MLQFGAILGTGLQWTMHRNGGIEILALANLAARRTGTHAIASCIFVVEIGSAFVDHGFGMLSVPYPLKDTRSPFDHESGEEEFPGPTDSRRTLVSHG